MTRHSARSKSRTPELVSHVGHVGMARTEAITDLSEAATEIRALLERVRKEGRRVLVVIGAGCSYAANVPLMKDVYKYLRARLDPDPTNPIPDEHGHLARLREWLSILAEEGGPRSLAARSLGQFQQPQLIEDASVRDRLMQVWDAFALDFLTWKVTAPERPTKGPTILTAKPTEFHRRIASWVKEDLASVVSLNFDGLMRSAIEEECGGRCIILAKREEIDGHWLGEKPANKKADDPPMRALIKVWGDVFHAKCRNSLCRAFGNPVALYDLRRNQSLAEKTVDFDAAKLLACPDCGDGRQLQVFFTGYQQKEEDAESVLDGIRERIMPAIGGIITVGVSGLWDAPLRRLLSEIGQYLQDTECTAKASARVLCLDLSEDDYFLARELRQSKIELVHLACGAEKLAAKLKPVASSPIGSELADSRTAPRLTDKMLIKWTDHLFGGQVWWPPPLGQVNVNDGAIYEQFGLIRQLGLKTAIVKAKSKMEGKEEDHNRLVHSVGTAYISFAWMTKLIEKAGGTAALGARHFRPPVLRSATFLACMTHDLNHLPFTHLIEEIFAELNWTATPWTSGFRHDRDVLNGCNPALSLWAQDTLRAVSAGLGLTDTAVLSGLVSRAIEGRSGIAALDAIVNSPIDADKIEYVASDSRWTGQEVHLPIRDGSQWRQWLDTFFAGQEILPSGVIAISGAAAENAYQLLEERRWLYKQLYFRPAFRAAERIVRHLLARWLTWHVGLRIASWKVGEERWLKDGGIHPDPMANALDAVILGDSRALKGRVAAELLWEALISPEKVFDQDILDRTRNMSGEPRLAILVGEQVAKVHVEQGSPLTEWYMKCASALRQFLQQPENRSYEEFEKSQESVASWSGRMYIHREYLSHAAKIVQRLEYESEPSALIDLAPIPPMLSFPDTRKHRRGSEHLFADCWVVPHEDPERWNRRTGRWVPLSRTALARRDLNRWVQILVVSPRPHDQPALQYTEDRFRLECDKQGIVIHDENPEGE